MDQIVTPPAMLTFALVPREDDGLVVELHFEDPGSAGEMAPARGQAIFNWQALRMSGYEPQEYGQELIRALLAEEELQEYFKKAWNKAEDGGLRIVLQIDPGAPARLHSLRWETLCHPSSGKFLCLDANLPFSRFLESLEDWKPIKLKPRGELRALVAAANPVHLPAALGWGGKPPAKVNVRAELERARLGLEGVAELVELGNPTEGRVTFENLLAHLRQGYDLLYLVCHGAIFQEKPGDPNSPEESILLLEKNNRRPDYVRGADLADAIAKIDADLRPRLVVLVSCASAGRGEIHRQPEATPETGGPRLRPEREALAAVGPLLAAAGIPAVVAMQGYITMETASRFMQVFFIEMRRDGRLDRAMAIARDAVDRDRSDDWWMPVLFTRLKDGQLFSKAAAPALKSQTPQNYTLPDEGSSVFVGRTEQLQMVLQELQDGTTNVVVIQGKQSMGKASLALAAARRCLEQGIFPGAVWVNAGYQETDLQALLRMISRTLLPGASQAEHESRKVDEIIYLLSQSPCLIVVAKLFHNDQPVIDFLEAVPSPSRAMVTTTTHLNLGRQPIKVDILSRSAAIELIKKKAQNEGYEALLNATEADLEPICVVCGYSPAAINWAVGQIFQGLPLEQVLASLTEADADLFQIWSSSYELLSPAAREILLAATRIQKSVSYGTLAHLTGLEAQELRSGLAMLVKMALLDSNAALWESKMRYQLYTLTRRFATERLEEQPELLERLDHRAEAYWVSFIQENGRENWNGYPKLAAEFENLQAVFDALTSKSCLDEVLVYVSQLYYFLRVTGRWQVLLDWGQKAADAAEKLGRPAEKARNLVRVKGWTEMKLGRFEAAEKDIEDGLKIYQAENELSGQVSALRYLGTIRRKRRNYSEADQYYSQALEVARSIPDENEQMRLQASVLISQGTLAFKLEDYRRAEQAYSQARDIYWTLGHKSRYAELLSRLGDVHRIEEKYDLARDDYQESQTIATEIDRQDTLAYNLLGLGYISEAYGETAKALEQVEQAYKLFQSLAVVNEMGEISETEDLLARLRKTVSSQSKV